MLGPRLDTWKERKLNFYLTFYTKINARGTKKENINQNTDILEEYGRILKTSSEEESDF